MTNKKADLICFSHLRWGFVFQRPQHLMSRFARERRVFFFEEPEFDPSLRQGHLRRSTCDRTSVVVATPVLPPNLSPQEFVSEHECLLDELMKTVQIKDYVSWYYTPMAREFSRRLRPGMVVYDCMDELSAFAGAPPAMRLNESDLFSVSDLVFTGGASLYEAKRKQHSSVHLFPSSVDVAHFRGARIIASEPVDQASIPLPRLGYAGVIDERMDLALLAEIAALRPQWHFVMLGPVAKIDPSHLPKAPNLHYLGMKPYSELPNYFSGWSIGMLPFATNEATKYISPTKTPEYLAAGLRVVSTPIRDVVTPYGDLGLAEIASNARDFVGLAEELLTSPQDSVFRRKTDGFLSKSSWDVTWARMDELIECVWTTNAKASSVPYDEHIFAEGTHV